MLEVWIQPLPAGEFWIYLPSGGSNGQNLVILLLKPVTADLNSEVFSFGKCCCGPADPCFC